MIIILLIAAIALVIYFKNRDNGTSQTETQNKPEPYVYIDPATLPNTIAELRAAIGDNQSRSYNYACRRKIVEVGIELFMQRKLVGREGDEFDITAMIKDISTVCFHSFSDSDPEFKFRCNRYGYAMCEYIARRKQVDPSVYYDMDELADFAHSAAGMLAYYYSEGMGVSRNTFFARKFLRLNMTMNLEGEHKLEDRDILRLMEISEDNETAPQEINKWLAIKFAMGEADIRKGTAIRNFFASTIQQSAQLLYQMDLKRIGSSDVSVMLDEYNKCAETGNAYAQYKLGMFYKSGRFLPQDQEKGMELLLKAAKKGLYLAAREVFKYYNDLASPYAGNYGNASKEQINAYEDASREWSNRLGKIDRQLEAQYNVDFYAHYIPSLLSSTNISYSAPVIHEETEEEYFGSTDETDMESIFTILDLPDVIKDVYGNVYHKTNIGANYADYHCDNGNNTTIHLSEINIGITGFSAKNSDGYFSW